MSVEISIAVIAIAFAALVIALIYFIIGLQKTLSQVNQTLIDVRQQMDMLGGQTHQISLDVKGKLEALNPIFNTLSNVGEFLDEKTMDLSKESERAAVDSDEEVIEEDHKESVKAGDVLELVDAGIRLWKKIKKRR